MLHVKGRISETRGGENGGRKVVTVEAQNGAAAIGQVESGKD